jgi:diguanylate cyclase (GGDEF)-like protein/PAS domain S-box-containing protein
MVDLVRHDGPMEHDSMRVEQRGFSWGGTGPDGPELVVHRQIESLFDFREIALGLLIGVGGLLAALWGAIGVWVYRNTGRVAALGRASRQFLVDYHASPEIKHLLEQARGPSDDEINEVVRSLEMLTDTVALRDAEREAQSIVLRESEARIREITSVLADGVYVLDQFGVVTFVNPEAERLLGWAAAELVGKDGHDTFHYKTPDGQPLSAEDCPVHKTIRTGQTYRSIDDWLVRQDGSIIPVDITSSPIIRDGGVRGSVAAFHDITPRLEAGKALRESEERFRLISTSAMDAMVIVDSAQEITYWNPAAEVIFGYPASEALGRNLHYLVAPLSHREAALRGFAQFLTTGTGPVIGKTFEISALRKDGGEFPVELSISAFRIKDQQHALGIVRDISERKRTEEQIRQLAYYDTLTNLPNRRMLLDRLAQSLTQAIRHQRSLAVMFLDLDRFKLINDALGHDVGDALLKVVATRLNASVRSGDTVSRQGGDEFVIILAEIAQPTDAALVAEKILATLSQPISLMGHELRITTSIGIAIYPVNGTDDMQELLKKADSAMYAVKEAGRNGYRFYHDQGADQFPVEAGS